MPTADVGLWYRVPRSFIHLDLHGEINTFEIFRFFEILVARTAFFKIRSAVRGKDRT